MMGITLGRHCSIRLFFVLFFLLTLVSGLVFIHPAHAVPATVSVSPAIVTEDIGENFSISANIASVMDLYSWEFKLSWNATLLDVVNVVEGPFLKAGGSTFFTYRVNDTIGYLVADCTLLGMVHGVSGSGVLASMTFHVKSVGECPFRLYDVMLLDSFEQPIPNQATDGYGYFTYQHDVAITNVNASPLVALPSDMVSVNVTAKNQGGYAEDFNVTSQVNSTIVGAESVFLDSGSSTIVPFTWNTTNFRKGDYTISASASIVSGEVDTEDNTKMADSMVTILYNGHDVAIVKVEPLKAAVGQNCSTYIDVTVKNYGIFTETFSTTVYVNTTDLQTLAVTLTNGSSTKLTFTWNTTDWSRGNYTIKAYTWPVPQETYVTDNELTDGTVRIIFPGDVNMDGKVDMRDIGIICNAFGSKRGQPGWNSNADINNDQLINMRDIGIACDNFGEMEL